MLTRTAKGGGSTTRPATLTTKGQVTVALIRLERALGHLTDAEQQDLADELAPIVRCARSRAESRQSAHASAPLVARLMA